MSNYLVSLRDENNYLVQSASDSVFLSFSSSVLDWNWGEGLDSVGQNRRRALGNGTLNGLGYFLAILLHLVPVDFVCALSIRFSFGTDGIICRVWMSGETHHQRPGFCAWGKGL